MGTAMWQYVTGLTSSRTVAQVSDAEWQRWPYTYTRECAVILNNRRVTIHEVPNHLQIIYGSVPEIIWTDQAFIRIVQYGSQASHRSTSSLLEYLPVLFELLWKWRLWFFLDAPSVWRKYKSTTIIQRLNTRVWNGNIHSYQSKESSDATNSKQLDVFFFLLFWIHMGQ